jgi:hypothetical protein
MDAEYLAEKILSDGRVGQVFPLTFGRARLGIGVPNTNVYDAVY